jgi:hypothetical protein
MKTRTDIQAIVKVAHEELRRLIQQRIEIMERIGSIKQTITGLCKLFGEDVLSDDLRELVNSKAGVRQQGITQACRRVLMEAARPVTAREICEQIQQQIMPGSQRSKNLIASVTTVLSRLVQYGEARTVPRDTGPRAWLWVSESGDRTPHSMNSAKHLVSDHGLDGL